MTATSVTFLLSKDPLLEHGGDVEMFRLILGLAAEDFDESRLYAADYDRRFRAGRADAVTR